MVKRAKRPTRSASVILGALAIALRTLPGATACFPCTLRGWYEGLTLSIRSANGPFDGAYTIDLVADDTSLAIPILVPAGMSAQCLGDEAMSDCVTQIDLGDDRSLWVSLTQINADQFDLNVYRADGDGLDGGPAMVTVNVSRDGAIVGGLSITPTYTQRELNGNGCGVATEASAELVVAAAP